MLISSRTLLEAICADFRGARCEHVILAVNRQRVTPDYGAVKTATVSVT